MVTERVHMFLALLLTASDWPGGLMRRSFDWCFSFFFFSFMFLTNLPVCAVRGSSVVFFFGLRLGFVLFCFNCNCEIIVSYLLISYLTIVSFVFILLAGGWSMT